MPQTPATARTAADVDPEARQEAPPMGPLLNRTGARVPLCFFVGFLFLDATSAVILGASTVGFDFHPFHWGSIDSFEDRTVDVVVLIAVRLVLCAAVAVPLRMYLLRCQWTLEETLRCEAAGDQGKDDDQEEDDADCQGERTSFLSTRDKKGTTSKNRHGKRRSATTTPSGAPSPAGQRLRGASADQEEDYLAIPTDALCVETTNGAGPFDAARRRSTLRSTQSMQRIVVLLILFVFFTAFNIFVAIKCLYFHYTLSPWQQLAMALSVVWTNAEMLCLKLYLERATGSRDGDALHPKLHPHPLRFNHHVTCTKCDVCSQRIEREGFECAGTCSFDCCLVCFRKRTAAHGENLLSRTDKGSGIQGGKNDGSVSPWQYIFRGMKIILPFWRLVLLAMACLVANQTVRVALPKFQGEVLDSVVTARQDDFWRNIRWYLALSVTLLLVGSIRTFCIQLVMRNVVFSLRERVYESLIYRDVAFFDGATVGALTSRMTTDVNAMVSPLSALFNTVIANVILLVGGMGMCLQVSWKLSMISFSVVGPILFISSAYAKWSSKLNRSIWDSLAQANSQATEAFSNIRTVKSFSTEGLELARYGETIKMALSQTLRDAIANAGSTFAASTLDLGQGVIILAFGGMMAITDPDEISVGQLVTFQLYVNMMNGAYQSLNGVLNQFTKSAGAAERVLAMLESTTSIDPRAGAPIPDLLFQGTLRFENVSFRYQMRADRIALRGVNITFPQRKVTAIVGKSGGGKSTIMHLLLRMYDPTEGRITVDGVDMREVQLRWLHERMAVVAQDTQLFNATIADNIRYGAVRTQHDGGNARAHGAAATSLRSDAAFEGDGGASFVTIVSEDGMKTTTTTAAARAISDEEVRQAAMRANAHDFIESFPEGYRTVVGERGVRLSGGQRQRIAIARALLRRPKILLLDEATSALDAESEAQVQSALDTLIQDLHRSDDANASCAVIVVAHRLSTVSNADNIVVLQDGTVAEEGTHSELLERQGVYFQLVHKQLQEGRMTAVFDGAPAVDDATTAAAVPTSTASKPMAEGVVDGNDAVGGERRPDHRGGRGSGGRRRGGTARE